MSIEEKLPYIREQSKFTGGGLAQLGMAKIWVHGNGGGAKFKCTSLEGGGKISVQGILPCQLYFVTSPEKFSRLRRNILIYIPNFLSAYSRRPFLS